MQQSPCNCYATAAPSASPSPPTSLPRQHDLCVNNNDQSDNVVSKFKRYTTTYRTIFVLYIALAECAYCFAQGQITADDDLTRLLGRCKSGEPNYDDCMKRVFNDLRAFFPTGLPAYNVKPFDPHRSPFVELRRGDQNMFGGFKLILRNISEYGWSQSEVTKYRTDRENKRIIYAQYFPEKSLDGWYEFSGKILGTPVKRRGFWNMTLYDYSQTTSVRRLGEVGALLKVHVEVDRIGGLKMHVANVLAEGRQNLDNVADGVINSMWPIGLPFIKPIINELVSSAFTDIFNESFRYFPMAKFLA